MPGYRQWSKLAPVAYKLEEIDIKSETWRIGRPSHKQFLATKDILVLLTTSICLHQNRHLSRPEFAIGRPRSSLRYTCPLRAEAAFRLVHPVGSTTREINTAEF